MCCILTITVAAKKAIEHKCFHNFFFILASQGHPISQCNSTGSFQSKTQGLQEESVKHGLARSKHSFGFWFRLAISCAVSSWQFLVIACKFDCNRSISRVSLDFGKTAARWSGVWPPVEGVLTFAPHAKRVSAQSAWFQRQAEWRGVQPSEVRAETSDPALSNVTKLAWN